MSIPKVSIVLPTYNQAEMLSTAVESVVSQAFKDFEFIIVNDGSTDDTKKYLESIVIDNYPIVIHQENRKLAGALNSGFAKAKGEYLTWISSDCYCAPNFLKVLVDALDAFPEAGLAYADFFFIDEGGRIMGRISNPDYNYRSLLIKNDGNAAFMYRRKCMEDISPEQVLEALDDLMKAEQSESK